MLRHFNFEVLRCIIIASPGFIKVFLKPFYFNLIIIYLQNNKDQFFAHMNTMAQKNDFRTISANKDKFVLVHSSSGHKFVFTYFCCCF